MRGLLFSRFSAVLLALLIAIGGIGYFLFFTDQFLIRQINVNGGSQELRGDVLEYFHDVAARKRLLVLRQDKTFFFPEGTFESEVLRAVPRVRNADVKTELPHNVAIAIEEREQKGIWCAAAGGTTAPPCYFYDTEGVIYAEAPSTGRGSLITRIVDKRRADAELSERVLSAEDIQQSDAVRTMLDVAFQKPSYITIESEHQMRAGFSAGWEAYFSRGKDLQTQVENLALVVEKEIASRENELEYVDVRLGEKVFYRYAGEDAESID